MITDALLTVLFGLVDLLLLVFPSWAPPASPGLAALSAANLVLPLGMWATLFGASLAFGLAGLTLWAGKMAFNAIRGSGA